MASAGYRPNPIVLPGGRGRSLSAAKSSRVAVIDIGSNSIRLVVYDRLRRVPSPIFNEKVLCGLGRGLAATGRLNPEGVRRAMANLARFRALLEGMQVDQVDVLATAAVREAADRAAFVDEVRRKIGLEIQVISGSEEARLSALGVLSGLPEADGVIGDLGGGSLELVGVDRGVVGKQMTLPLGPFRLMDSAEPLDVLRAQVADMVAAQTWLSAYRGRTFYPVGGNWRAIAKVHMAAQADVIHIIQNYAVRGDELTDLVSLLARQGKASLERIRGLSKRRVDMIGYAALAMEGVLRTLKPKEVVFSAYGLREGHLFDLLPEDQREEDPLLHSAEDLARSVDRFGDAQQIMQWTDGVMQDETAEETRLRHAACLLSDIAWMEHPDYRAEHAFLRTLRMPLAGITHDQRAWLAAAQFVRYGGNIDAKLIATAVANMSESQRQRAEQVGHLLRLGHTITGGASSLLAQTRLMREPDSLTLYLFDGAKALDGEVLQRRLDSVGKILGQPTAIRLERPVSTVEAAEAVS